MPNGELNTDSLHLKKQLTPQKFNIAPEKGWLEDYFPFGTVYFQGRTVKLQVGNHNHSCMLPIMYLLLGSFDSPRPPIRGLLLQPKSTSHQTGSSEYHRLKNAGWWGICSFPGR